MALSSLARRGRPSRQRVAVSEITSGVRTRPHSLTPWAEVNGIQITYPDATAPHEPRHPAPAPSGTYTALI